MNGLHGEKKIQEIPLRKPTHLLLTFGKNNAFIFHMRTKLVSEVSSVIIFLTSVIFLTKVKKNMHLIVTPERRRGLYSKKHIFLKQSQLIEYYTTRVPQRDSKAVRHLKRQLNEISVDEKILLGTSLFLHLVSKEHVHEFFILTDWKIGGRAHRS